MTHPARTHPRHDLDEIIHAPVRLSIMAALDPVESIEFGFLRDTLEVSDSLLSKHLRVLEDAGYVELRKAAAGRRVRTWVAGSDQGRAAFADYLATLRAITG